MLLRQIGLEFAVRVPRLEEAPVNAGGEGVTLEEQVIKLACDKAAAVARRMVGEGCGFGTGTAPESAAVAEYERAAGRAAAAHGATACLDSSACGQSWLVIGADTVVLIDGEVLGKPADPAEAASMLTALSGRTHVVYTGVAVLDSQTGRLETGVERTEVTFVQLPREWVISYVATGEPMDKAGAYAVQGLGSAFIERINGCYFNVVGLPLTLLARLLRRHDFEITEAW